MREFKITKKYENKKIDYVIEKQFPRLSKSSLNKAFRLKDVKVNETRVTKDYMVSLNDTVKIYLTDNLLFGIGSINYIYEDDNILVAYKPKGIESNNETNISSNNIYFEDLVKKEKGNNLKICHRLDLNTEGLVIFSKNQIAYEELLGLFKDRNILKEYIALVYGKLDKTQDILSHYILKDNKTGFSKVIEKNVKGSKKCITEYNVIKYIKKNNVSILNIILHTGRTHQIRAHMKYISHPVIGDSKYSTNEINKKFKLNSQVLFATKYTFNFSKSSPLYYLNKVNIDITETVIGKIYNLIN